MFPRAVLLGTVRGVQVRADPSLLVIALLVLFSFWQRFTTIHGHPSGGALVMALLATFLFFASVFAHELAHALEARGRDLPVGGITLFLFGGVTEMRGEPRRPRDEFALAAVGPYTSLAAAAAFGLVATYAGVYGPPSLRPIADIAGLLGWLNLGLALFNMLPGAPLDGGRVLRAVIWALTGSRDRATRGAARSGQALGIALLVAGVSLLVLRGRLADGLWLGVVGWFLFQAATGELEVARLRGVLRGRTIRSVVTPPSTRLDADAAIAMVELPLATTPAEVLPVVRDGELVGALTPEDVARIDPLDRQFRTVGELMRPVEELPRVDADAPLESVLLGEVGPILRVVGPDLDTVVTRAELLRSIERLRRLGGVAA